MLDLKIHIFQDQLYVQYVEIFLFNGRFDEIATKFSDNEKLIKKLSLNVSSIDEVNHILDQLDSVIDALTVDALRAKKLSKFGKDLMAQHPFTQDLLEARCAEIKVMCKRQEMLLLEKRRILLKLLDLFEVILLCVTHVILVSAPVQIQFVVGAGYLLGQGNWDI